MDLLSTNVKDPKLKEARILIVGKCLKSLHPDIIKKFADGAAILEHCPEELGINISSKIATMIRVSKPKEIIVLTVDGSPHCTAMHMAVRNAAFIAGFKNIRHLVVVYGEVREVSGLAVTAARYLSVIESLISAHPDAAEIIRNLSSEFSSFRAEVRGVKKSSG